MAEDVVALLDYLGWNNPHDLHVVGCSLGGMIAIGMCTFVKVGVGTNVHTFSLPELASRIPERIISLNLNVTTAGGFPWNNLPPHRALSEPSWCGDAVDGGQDGLLFWW